MVDARVTNEYARYLDAHSFVHISDPEKTVPPFEDDCASRQGRRRRRRLDGGRGGGRGGGDGGGGGGGGDGGGGGGVGGRGLMRERGALPLRLAQGPLIKAAIARGKVEFGAGLDMGGDAGVGDVEMGRGDGGDVAMDVGQGVASGGGQGYL